MFAKKLWAVFVLSGLAPCLIPNHALAQAPAPWAPLRFDVRLVQDIVPVGQNVVLAIGIVNPNKEPATIEYAGSPLRPPVTIEWKSGGDFRTLSDEASEPAGRAVSVVIPAESRREWRCPLYQELEQRRWSQPTGTYEIRVSTPRQASVAAGESHSVLVGIEAGGASFEVVKPSPAEDRCLARLAAMPPDHFQEGACTSSDTIKQRLAAYATVRDACTNTGYGEETEAAFARFIVHLGDNCKEAVLVGAADDLQPAFHASLLRCLAQESPYSAFLLVWDRESGFSPAMEATYKLRDHRSLEQLATALARSDPADAAGILLREMVVEVVKGNRAAALGKRSQLAELTDGTLLEHADRILSKQGD